MKNITFKDVVPYLVAIVLFVVITMIYFNPLLQGKKLKQDDIINHKGMSKEITDFREKTGEEALWTNSMFGGMPAYQISVKYKSNLFRYIDKIFLLGLPRPAGYVFLYFVGFFILLLTLRVNPWLSIAGAIAFAFSSYFFIILDAGHNSKAHAIGYMAPVLAGIILTYRGKYILGGILTALFLALEIQAGHPQITYYLLIIVVILGLVELGYSVYDKQLKKFLIATGILVLVAVFAVLTHFTNLWATYEYGKDTIRGKSELTLNQENQTSGLDKDYATDWSYGIAETFTLMIPNTKGGATDALANNEKALDKVDRNYKQIIAGQNQYWGDQPFTSGPVYVGAVIVFLFVLGLFIVKGRLKWILLAATVLSIMLSWGKNFMPLTDFFLDYIPGYNKFRAVSMTLVIAELTIPILAILALNKVIKNPSIINEKRNYLYISFGITGGLALLFYLFPGFFNFFSTGEIEEMKSQIVRYFMQQGATEAQIQGFLTRDFPAIVDNLETARISIFRADAIRSFLYILIAGIVLWLYGMKKVNWPILIAIFAVIILADMTTVAYRYLNKDDFVRKSTMRQPFEKSAADKHISQDKDRNFRVLNLAVNTFNDASTSYFHKSIGGYHGAKLRRYQELIEYGISPEITRLKKLDNKNTSMQQFNALLRNSPVLNMLNTKYIILRTQLIFNQFALGHAWFVDDFEIVEDADAEIKAIRNFDPEKTAIIDKRFEDKLADYTASKDSLAGIELINYKPNHLRYTSNASKEQLVVFSEIYYDKGWKAFVDDKLTPHFRVNYVLRAMIVPQGKHTIEFKFEPQVYYTGETVSLISSIILLLFILGGAYLVIRKRVETKE